MSESNGLLDFISSPVGQGLLSAAFGGAAAARRGGTWNTIGAAGLNGLAGYSNAIDRQSQQADNDVARQYRQAQLEKMQRDQEAEQRQREAVAQILPTLPQADQQAITLGVSPAEIYKRNNPEKKWVDGFDSQGRPVKGWADAAGFTQIGGAQAKPVDWVDIGGKLVAKDAYTGMPTGDAMGKTMSPDAAASNAIARANLGISQQRLVFDQNQAMKPQFKDGVWVTPPTVNNPSGTITKTELYAPAKGSPDANTQASKKVLPIISEAESLLDKSTGSYAGAGYDQAAAFFGKSTEGAKAAAKLKALEGSLMMYQPRMEGPQSDKDVALYRQMAAQIGDPTVPVETRKAALDTIKQLHQQYAGVQEQKSTKNSTMSAGGWSASIVK